MLKSQEIRKIAPEMHPLRIGMGWKVEDLSKPQVIVESTFGDSHPGSAHLFALGEQAQRQLTNTVAKLQDILQQTFATVCHKAKTA